MRAALPEDVDELAALEAELFPDNCFNENTLRNEMKISRCWVEDKGGKLIGYVLVRVEDDLVDILRLGVRPGNHRQGIATRLLTKALGQAPTADAVLTVKKDNAPAMSLYFNFGFRIISHLEGDEAWVMFRACG
jgi:ribosomal protein S18 acetylase RimI-like enzyme